jgi:lipoic acid synthetase
MRDLHDAGCELLTITQYLRPSVRHHPVERWVTPEEFAELREEALEIGFAGVMSGPLVRSSYRAGRLYREAMTRRRAATSATHSVAPVPLQRVSRTRLHSERPGS